MPTDAPSEEDRRRIRRRHRPWPHLPDVCAGCAQPWPCDAARLLAALDRETAHWRAAEDDLASCRAEVDRVMRELGGAPKAETVALLLAAVARQEAQAAALTARVARLEADLALCGAELRGYSDEADRAERVVEAAREWRASLGQAHRRTGLTSRYLNAVEALDTALADYDAAREDEATVRSVVSSQALAGVVVSEAEARRLLDDVRRESPPKIGED